jgi:hypothetical protein
MIYGTRSGCSIESEECQELQIIPLANACVDCRVATLPGVSGYDMREEKRVLDAAGEVSGTIGHTVGK